MIESNGVSIQDGLFNEGELDGLIQTVNAIPLHFVNQSDYQKTHELYCHWHYPIVVNPPPSVSDVESDIEALDESLDPIRLAWYRMKPLLPEGSRVYDCYINGNTYGTEGYPHIEVFGRRRDWQYTALIYCSRAWKPEWAGETVFFDDNDEICAASLPKPGRALVFRGNIKHVARSPSRFCPIERRVLVFKVWLDGCPPPERQPK